MYISRVIASVALLAGMFCGQAVAQEEVSPEIDTSPVAALEARDTWYASQTLVRSAMRVEVAREGRDETEIFWMYIERTPNGRSRVVIRDSADSPSRLTLLVQGKTNMVMAGNDVTGTAAPWMLGQHLFGQAMEPTMLLDWSMGVPGKDFSVENHMAQVNIRGEVFAGLVQSGWEIQYGQWSEASDGRPALPRQMRLIGDHAEVMVSVVDMEAYISAPTGYSEFRIM